MYVYSFVFIPVKPQAIEALEAEIDLFREHRQNIKKEFDEQVIGLWVTGCPFVYTLPVIVTLWDINCCDYMELPLLVYRMLKPKR